MAKQPIFGKDPEKLSRLLSIGEDEQDLSEVQEDVVDSPVGSDSMTTKDHVIERLHTKIEGYRIIKVLGEGGMGIVYLAEQQYPVQRPVALKIIKPGMDTKLVMARFEAEQQALARLDHPNIAHIYGGGTTELDRPYFVMEYIEGIPITDYCDHHKLTIKDRLGLFMQVCQAVQHAHQKGIIHRDIKPSNILVSVENDQAIPKIIDFGVAKATGKSLTKRTFLTEDRQLLGTPEYMSPEQADMVTEDIDTRSDIYSLGVLLYVLLTGVLPFDSDTLREGGFDHVRKIIREIDPKTPSTRLTRLGEDAKKVAESRRTEVATLAKCLHRELEWIPLKAMRKERDERYRSASELADDVENYLNGNPLFAGPPSTVYRLKKLVRRNAAITSAVLTAIATLVVGLIATTAMYIQADHARAEAQSVSDLLQKSITSSLNLRQVTGKEITVRSILDAISKNLEVEFQDQPLFGISIQNELISAYGVLGLYKQAESHAKRAIEIRRTLLGPENIATLHSMYQLGWLYMIQNRYSEAEPLLTEALASFKLALDEEHPSRLWCMAFLGWVYNVQGRFPEAEALFKDGLDVTQRTRGPEHPLAPFLMYSWSFAHYLQGRYQEAERLYLKGLEISRQIRGEQHDDTLFLMDGLGVLYWDMGRYDKAEELLQAALKARRKIWGEEHPRTLRTMTDLGWLYHSQGRYEEAESLFVKAVKTSREVLGEAHCGAALSIHGLGVLYLSQGRYDEAEPLLDEVLGIANHVMGEETWFTLRIMNTLARLYTAQGRYKEADNMFQKTLAARRRIWDANHPEIYETMNDLGVLYRIQDRYDDAEDLLNKALEGRRRKLGEEHPETLRSMNDLAVFYKEQGNYAKAEPLFLETIEGRRLKLGDTHPHTKESLNTLIDLYESWNKPEKAEQWRAKLPKEN